jgi:hypothetical protein
MEISMSVWPPQIVRFGDRVPAADDVVGRGAELAHLAGLGCSVERGQLGAD